MASRFHAISEAMEQWTAQHRAFVVVAYFKNGDSVVTPQLLFRRHFNILRHGRVPCRNTIKEWVQNFRENVSALERNPRGRLPTVRTPENVDKVRMAIVKSPRRSVRRHSAVIGLSDRSVRRILHKDLNFHRSLISMVSARWSNSPQSKGINECSAGNVSTTRHFPWRRCSMAGTFA